MIRPTEHYEELRQGLEGYKHDEGYLTLKDCVAHILLDVRVWARSHGLCRDAIADAYRLALGMEKAQIRSNLGDMSWLEIRLKGQPRSVVNARCVCRSGP